MRYSASFRHLVAVVVTLLFLFSGVQSQSCTGVTIEVYDSEADCHDINVPPTTTGIVYGDGQCRTVETTSIGALYDQLPGTYRATCDAATNSITFTDSSCATGTCSTLGTDRPGACKRTDTVPSFIYSASTPPDQPAAYQVTTFTSGSRVCNHYAWRTSSGLELNAFFAIRGTCDCVVERPIYYTLAPFAPLFTAPDPINAPILSPVSRVPATSSPVKSSSSPVSSSPRSTVQASTDTPARSPISSSPTMTFPAKTGLSPVRSESLAPNGGTEPNFPVGIVAGVVVSVVLAVALFGFLVNMLPLRVHDDTATLQGGTIDDNITFNVSDDPSAAVDLSVL